MISTHMFFSQFLLMPLEKVLVTGWRLYHSLFSYSLRQIRDRIRQIALLLSSSILFVSLKYSLKYDKTQKRKKITKTHYVKSLILVHKVDFDKIFFDFLTSVKCNPP